MISFEYLVLFAFCLFLFQLFTCCYGDSVWLPDLVVFFSLNHLFAFFMVVLIRCYICRLALLVCAGVESIAKFLQLSYIVDYKYKVSCYGIYFLIYWAIVHFLFWQQWLLYCSILMVYNYHQCAGFIYCSYSLHCCHLHNTATLQLRSPQSGCKLFCKRKNVWT